MLSIWHEYFREFKRKKYFLLFWTLFSKVLSWVFETEAKNNMLPYKYVIIIYMLPLTLGKIFDKVLTTNNKEMCLSALDAMLSVVQAGEHTVLPLLKLSKHVFMTRGTLYSICHNCNNNRNPL